MMDADSSIKNEEHSNVVGAQIETSDAVFRQIATNIPEALLIGDVGSKLLSYVNPAWEKLTGCSSIANTGDMWDTLFRCIHPDDCDRVIECYLKSPKGSLDIEYRIARADGQVRWAHARNFAIAEGPNTASRVVVILEDITERKEKSLRDERLKDDFVATVSHELRTPLTSIAGSLGLLIGNAAGTLPQTTTRLLSIAHANSQRLVRLVNDILDIEKIESGKVIFILKRVDVSSVVEQVIEANRSFAESYDVRLRHLTPKGRYEIQADPDWLFQVVTNLVSNAIKFSPPREEVTIAVVKHAGTIKISVRDHGSGIPESFKPRVFQKFAQADASDARKKGGTGLGLSIVKQIVVRLGGDVYFGDAADGGTVFTVELPDWAHRVKSKPIASKQELWSDASQVGAFN